MLRGTKPLAYFMDVVGRELDICIRYWRMFDTHVAVGRLIRREVIEAIPDLPKLNYRKLFYALPGHEWRVGAHAYAPDRTRGLVRRPRTALGELLGYEGWQIDYWLTHRSSPEDA